MALRPCMQNLKPLSSQLGKAHRWGWNTPNWAVLVAVLRFKNKIGKTKKTTFWAMCVRPWCQIFTGVQASMHECCEGNMHPALVVLCKGCGWLFLANFTNWHPLPAQPCMVQVHRSSAWRCFVLRWLHGRLCPPT